MLAQLINMKEILKLVAALDIYGICSALSDNQARQIPCVCRANLALGASSQTVVDLKLLC